MAVEGPVATVIPPLTGAGTRLLCLSLVLI